MSKEVLLKLKELVTLLGSEDPETARALDELLERRLRELTERAGTPWPKGPYATRFDSKHPANGYVILTPSGSPKPEEAEPLAKLINISALLADAAQTAWESLRDYEVPGVGESVRIIGDEGVEALSDVYQKLQIIRQGGQLK